MVSICQRGRAARRAATIRTASGRCPHAVTRSVAAAGSAATRAAPTIAVSSSIASSVAKASRATAVTALGMPTSRVLLVTITAQPLTWAAAAHLGGVPGVVEEE